MAPSGIVVRGDTTVIGTADGLQVTTNDGAQLDRHRRCRRPAGQGPGRHRLSRCSRANTSAGWRRTAGAGPWLRSGAASGSGAAPTGWVAEPLTAAAFAPANALLIGQQLIRGTPVRPPARTPIRLPCLRQQARTPSRRPQTPLTIWFRRPIAPTDNCFIDQTYRYGSTMGGNFQQHQGVEFNNPDGTPVHAIGSGKVVYAGPAEQGALTVTIRHDTTVTANGKRYRIYSTYYHNSALR